MGRPALQTTEIEGGRGVASLTLREAHRDILAACAQSAVVTGIESLLIDEPILKLRIHLETLAFIDIFLMWKRERPSPAMLPSRSVLAH
jgi:hypothetical protein